MRSFLKGRKLWQVITRERVKFTQEKEEFSDKYSDTLEEWDNINHKIITWLINTSTPSIGALLHSFDTAKEGWIFLAKKYTTADLVHQYQLVTKIQQLHQESGQPLTLSTFKWIIFGNSWLSLNLNGVILKMLNFLSNIETSWDYEPTQWWPWAYTTKSFTPSSFAYISISFSWIDLK